MKPFITGSHAYGTPTSGSDIDLVIPPMMSNDLDTLILYSDNIDVPIKYGNINILVAPTEEAFWLWWECTKELKLKSPVTRDYAIEFIECKFQEAGIERFLTNSGEQLDTKTH